MYKNIKTVLESKDYILVELEGNKYPYQINSNVPIESSDWFCVGAWDKLEDAKRVFKAKYNN
ncbi:hypothetical protein JJB71_13200 [Clostridium perfringens]|uniref:hypothetical protein n=1 Tax=Clostridium perfringens TaxID=1502 RepID=UPI001ABA990E|nr:hypothetical protein [Clostridium perfringens]MBO3398495.1 hypothetical protein [Clostridium perfringens]